MDVFALRDGLIEQYRAYVQGFVKVREPRTQDFVDGYFSGGRLWPEPLVQLNPSFQPGRSVDELVQTGVLHRDCAQIFRRREHPGDIGRPVRLHQHQDAAIAAAQTGESYVLTTGTGSGKSLAYFVPIVDHILRAGAGKGIKAIVVYPMNALCNSQAQALEQFLNWGFPGGVGPLRFNRYTGQERDEQRQAIIAQPPDILLTNFVMLELILTRGDERALVEACQGLEFVVLDELPRTPSGKVDRLALPEPDVAASARRAEFVAPRTPIEEQVAAIWADVLGLERVSVQDDFFALGGHSLLATQIVAQIRSDFSIELPLHSLFTSPTVETLSQTIFEMMGGGGDEETAELLAQLENLSDEEAEQLLAGEISRDEERSHE